MVGGTWADSVWRRLEDFLDFLFDFAIEQITFQSVQMRCFSDIVGSSAKTQNGGESNGNTDRINGLALGKVKNGIKNCILDQILTVKVIELRCRLT